MGCDNALGTQDTQRIQGIRPITKTIHEKVSKMTNYYLHKILKNEIKYRHHKQLQALDNNYNHYHKYQTEYKIHHWLPPVTLEPPRDSSIEDLII
jgi:hypothetical protein